MKPIFVQKANGDKELFLPEKVKESIRKSGVSDDLHEKVLNHVRSIVYEGIPTSEIHGHIVEFLSKHDPFSISRFNLKKAIMELGPTGFPFERFVARLLQKYKYETRLDVVLNGACVKHEVDVFAHKSNRYYFVECKYHNKYGIKTDVKVILYIYARGEDLGYARNVQNPNGVFEPWVFTNTKFTKDAIDYAYCKKIRITGWNYPKGKSLNSMIEEHSLYPVTVLTSLSHQHKKVLFENNIVLVSDIKSENQLRQLLSLNEKTSARLQKEISWLKKVSIVDNSNYGQ